MCTVTKFLSEAEAAGVGYTLGAGLQDTGFKNLQAVLCVPRAKCH